MPVTVTLSTIPGALTRERGYTTKTIDLFGPSLAREALTAISTVPDIRAAVARFGARVRAEHPNSSFYVSVQLAKGHRKPSGYDAASNRNGFGQDEFMHVLDAQGTDLPSAAATDQALAQGSRP